MKKLIFSLALLLSLNSFSLTFPKVEQGQKNDFIPENWEVLDEASGDLNKDGKEDLVLYLANYKDKEKDESDEIDEYYAPKALLVLFKTEKGDYKLASKVLENLNINDTNVFLQNLIEMEVKQNNTLRLHYEYTRAGSTLVYRWQNNRMELIGEDAWAVYLGGTVFEDFSRNYSTGIEIVMENLNGSDKKINKIKSLGFPIEIETKRKFKTKRKYVLGESVGYDDLIYEPIDEKTEKLIEKFEKARELIYSLPDE